MNSNEKTSRIDRKHEMDLENRHLRSQLCHYAVDCPNTATGMCDQKYLGFQQGCGM